MDSLGCRATSCSRELAAQGPSSLAWLTWFKLLFSRVQHHCGVYTSASQCAQVQYTSLHGDKQNWINYCCLHKIATGDIKKKTTKSHNMRTKIHKPSEVGEKHSRGAWTSIQNLTKAFFVPQFDVWFTQVWSLWCEPPTAGNSHSVIDIYAGLYKVTL